MYLMKFCRRISSKDQNISPSTSRQPIHPILASTITKYYGKQLCNISDLLCHIDIFNFEFLFKDFYDDHLLYPVN